jgi:hypothetical protein
MKRRLLDGVAQIAGELSEGGAVIALGTEGFQPSAVELIDHALCDRQVVLERRLPFAG